ncbi:aldehyde dehydrogenase [Martensiomyces pterosporus]|nr:aldehyde dehydrogenase [Martensiomyces pterosporus]
MTVAVLPSLPFDEKRIYINGSWVESTATKTHSVENPDTAEVIAVVPECNAQDLDAAVQAAYSAFHDGPWVNEFSGAQRRDAMLALADAIEESRAEIELIESINTGKPISDVCVELDDTIDLFRHFAGYADKVEGRHIAPQTNASLEGYTVKVPVGVVGFINAFNYPICLLAWKVAPALAAGCTIVFKPGPQTPLTTQYFAHLLEKTGKFPPGVFNVVLGGVEVGQALVDHDLVDKIGFTGSVATGKHVIRSTASTKNVRSTSVELGGKSPGVVMPDADLDKTARLVVSGCMSNAGMNCNALTRLWIHRDVYDAFLPKLKAAAEALVVGMPQDSSTEMGPLIDKRQFDRVMEYIRIGREVDSAPVLTGGDRAFDRGYWVKPTLFYNVDPKARIATEEIFGPVLSILKPFDSLDEVIEIERRNEFGLAAGIFTRNHQAISKFTRRLRSGTIWVNNYNALYSYLPFGGFRNSGFGRELGYESFDGYLVPKAIIDDISY